jgi:hypothetical protein
MSTPPERPKRDPDESVVERTGVFATHYLMLGPRQRLWPLLRLTQLEPLELGTGTTR